MDARSVLGLRTLRPSLLDDVSAAEACLSTGRRAEARDRGRLVTDRDIAVSGMRRYVLDDDDGDDDEDDDESRDSDHEDDGDDEEEEETEETWQVSAPLPFR
jgi:hypothetical protein